MGQYLNQLKAKKDLKRPEHALTKLTKPNQGGSVSFVGSMNAHSQNFFFGDDHADDQNEVLNHLGKNGQPGVCVTDPGVKIGGVKDITNGQGTDRQNRQNHPAAGQVLGIEKMTGCLNGQPCRHLYTAADRPGCLLANDFIFDLERCPANKWAVYYDHDPEVLQ